jgi:hypothetical protein
MEEKGDDKDLFYVGDCGKGVEWREGEDEKRRKGIE